MNARVLTNSDIAELLPREAETASAYTAKALTRLEMYDWTKNKNGKTSVMDERGNKAPVRTREHANGTKYVQTYVDGIWTDNLLALPECR